MQALIIGGQQTHPTMFPYNRVQVRALYVFSETKSRCWCSVPKLVALLRETTWRMVAS